MDVTEQVEGVEAWVGGQLNSSGHAISVAVMLHWMLEHHVSAFDSFVNRLLKLSSCFVDISISGVMGTFQVAIPS